MKKQNNRLIQFQVKNIINKFVLELGIQQPPKFEIVPDGTIQDFIGSANFEFINDKMASKIALTQGILTDSNVRNKNSQLYITAYHELSHLKNIEQLKNNIPTIQIINDIGEYSDKESMLYDFAFMLWGEYYAYSMQLTKFNQTPDEYNLLLAIKTLCNDLVNGNHLLNNDNPLHNQYIKSLQQDIYNLLYAIVIELSYKNVCTSYDITPKINTINDLLHINIKEYVMQVNNSLHTMWGVGSSNLTIANFNSLGDAICQIYDILQFNISFDPEFSIQFDKTQPLLKFTLK